MLMHGVNQLVSFPYIGNRVVDRFSCYICDKTWEYCFSIWKASPGWCSELCSAGHHTKNFSCLVCDKTWVYCFQNWKLRPGWVYRTCFPPQCEQVGVFSILWEQSRQKVFLPSLWQNVRLYWFQIWKSLPGWVQCRAGRTRALVERPNLSKFQHILTKLMQKQTLKMYCFQSWKP